MVWGASDDSVKGLWRVCRTSWAVRWCSSGGFLKTGDAVVELQRPRRPDCPDSGPDAGVMLQRRPQRLHSDERDLKLPGGVHDDGGRHCSSSARPGQRPDVERRPAESNRDGDLMGMIRRDSAGLLSGDDETLLTSCCADY